MWIYAGADSRRASMTGRPPCLLISPELAKATLPGRFSTVPQSIEDRLRALDLGLLERIHSQTTDDDKRSLLALHGAVRDVYGPFTYLEIGSYLGGSLQALVADPACEKIISIDPRPEQFADNRLESVAYEDNNTERMLRLLADVPGADLTKVQTLETDTASLAPDRIDDPPRFCFIDGEHTNAAASHDARFCRAVLQVPGIIAFHDNVYVGPAIAGFFQQDGGFGYLLRDNVFVIEYGGRRVFNHPLVTQMVTGRVEWILANRLRFVHRVTGGPGPVETIRNRAGLRTRLRRAIASPRKR
jgi:hypothetical protein